MQSLLTDEFSSVAQTQPAHLVNATLSSSPPPAAPPCLCSVRREGGKRRERGRLLPLQIQMLSQIRLRWRRRRRRRDSYDNEFSGRVLRPAKSVWYPSKQADSRRVART